MPICPMCEEKFDTLNELSAHWTTNEIRPLGIGQKSYVITVPSSVPPGGVRAASALEDAIQIVLARHPDVQFTFVTYTQVLKDGVYATISVLAVPLINSIGSVRRKSVIDLSEDGEHEPLFISPQSRKALDGEWLRPARLTLDEIKEILDHVPARTRGAMHALLVVNGNRLVQSEMIDTSRMTKVFEQPINGKYYRLARGTGRSGLRHKQLWEVRPNKS